MGSAMKFDKKKKVSSLWVLRLFLFEKRHFSLPDLHLKKKLILHRYCWILGYHFDFNQTEPKIVVASTYSILTPFASYLVIWTQMLIIRTKFSQFKRHVFIQQWCFKDNKKSSNLVHIRCTIVQNTFQTEDKFALFSNQNYHEETKR